MARVTSPRAPIIKLKKKKVREVPAGGTERGPGQEPVPRSVARAPTLSPSPTLPFLVKQLKTDLTLKTKKPMNGVGKRKHSFLVL